MRIAHAVVLHKLSRPSQIQKPISNCVRTTDHDSDGKTVKILILNFHECKRGSRGNRPAFAALIAEAQSCMALIATECGIHESSSDDGRSLKHVVEEGIYLETRHPRAVGAWKAG